MGSTEDMMAAGGFDVEKVQLEQHQLNVVERLMRPEQRELIGALEMGTGKTFAGIASACAWRSMNPTASTLIVCPAALLHSVWGNEIRRVVDGGILHLVDSDARVVVQPGHIYVVSYSRLSGLFKKGWENVSDGEAYTDSKGANRTRAAWIRRTGCQFLEHRWSIVIFDESHHLRNPDRMIMVGNACARATRRAHKVLLLTGTPVQNRPSDISGQLRAASSRSPLVNPQELSDNDSHGVIPPCVLPMLKRLIMRVTFKDTGRALPPKTFHLVKIAHGLDGGNLELYNRILKDAKQLDMRPAGHGLPPCSKMLARLRYCLGVLRTLSLEPAFFNHHGEVDKNGDPAFTSRALELTVESPGPKISYVRTLATELLTRHDKIVISCESVMALRVLRELLLKDTGRAPLQFDGRLDARAKDQMIQRFLSDPCEHVLLLSLIAGGEGLNLVPGPTAMIVFCTWYNPAKHRQLEARIHRRGQTEPVEIHHVLCEGTVEEAVLATHTDKQACADILLGDYTPENGCTDTAWKKLKGIVDSCEPLAALAGVDRTHTILLKRPVDAPPVSGASAPSEKARVDVMSTPSAPSVPPAAMARFKRPPPPISPPCTKRHVPAPPVQRARSANEAAVQRAKAVLHFRAQALRTTGVATAIQPPRARLASSMMLCDLIKSQNAI
jgi:hypothetical protein